MNSGEKIREVRASAWRIPTDSPESDGTFEWDSTTLVLVEAAAGHVAGIGFSYANIAAAKMISESLAGAIRGTDAMDVNRAWILMVQAIRNDGRPGVSSMAISAVDNTLWDLKTQQHEIPLVKLLGASRDSLPI